MGDLDPTLSDPCAPVPRAGTALERALRIITGTRFTHAPREK
ncbi:MAG TPA: hypothetical protein PLO06_11300 [Methanoregulaceae archaeon]|nr:hypothetical protein [Methanoregulaceae archaeon]